MWCLALCSIYEANLKPLDVGIVIRVHMVRSDEVWKPSTRLIVQSRVLQIPSEKLFRPQKPPPQTISKGVWNCSLGFVSQVGGLYKTKFWVLHFDEIRAFLGPCGVLIPKGWKINGVSIKFRFAQGLNRCQTSSRRCSPRNSQGFKLFVHGVGHQLLTTSGVQIASRHPRPIKFGV